MLIAPLSNTYSRLFRPWDAAEGLKNKSKDRSTDEIEVSRLRKTRPRKDQDSTVSTTTVEPPLEEVKDDITERLSQSKESTLKNSLEKHKREQYQSVTSYPESLPQFTESYLQGLPFHHHPDLLLQHLDIAQSLGIPATDPLLLESFAQGYAMEMEYARIVHQESQNKLLGARKQRPKKYRCPHCDVGFSNNGQLKGHIRIHTGERPFKCDDKTCGKTFTRNEELTRHRRIHSGLRPYPCPTCGKKFGRRDHLKKHTRTHTAHAERMMPMFVPLAGYPYLYGY